MSLKENQLKNFNSQRTNTPHQRFISPGNSIQSAPMNAYQQPIYAPAMQQGPVPPRIHSIPHIPVSQSPVAYPSMGGQANNHVFSPYGNVSAPTTFNYPHGRIQTVYFQPQNIASQNPGIRYPLPHQMQASAPVEQLGLQQQIPANHVPFSTAQHQPQTAKQERPKSKKIIIRDPNQGGKDVTNEILSRKKTGSQPAPTITTGDVVLQPTSQESSIRETFMAKVSERKNNDKKPELLVKDPIQNEKEKELKEKTEILAEEVPCQLNDGKTSPEIIDDKEDSSQSSNIENATIEKESLEPDASSLPNESTEAIDVTDADGGNVQVEPNFVLNEELETNAVNAVDSEDAVPLDEFNEKNDKQTVGDTLPAEIGEEEALQKELEPFEIVEIEPITLNATSDICQEGKQEGAVEAPGDEDSTTDMIANENVNGDDISAGSISNGLEKPIQSLPAQGKKKKKGKYKDRDTDMMSAFVDKQEEEGSILTPEDDIEPEQIQEDEIKEETWEDKDIKTEDKPPKSDRICYDRNFLLGFQNSKEKPKGLPNIEPVLPEAHEPTKPLERGRLQSSGGGVDFMPTFMQKGSTGRQIGMSRSGKGGRAPTVKKIIPTNFEAKVELKKSDNAWVRPSESTKELPNDEREKAELFRKARGILNKLTPQRFEKLVEMMKSLQINTVDKLKGVIELIFEKSLSEPSFSKAYAQLCDSLAKQKMQIENGSNLTFKRILLNKCQAEFEKEKTDEQQLEKEQDKHFENAEEEKAWQEELALRRHLTKRRSLGNIRFIGELFKLKMLTEAIMHTCLCKLLKDRDEESLECLCQLLTTIGKDIDHEKAKPRTDQYFQQIDKIINQKKVSSRIIFMLKDVKDLRATKWISRRVTDAPKTIAEIHEEAKQEEIQMQLAHQQAAQKRMNNKGGGRDSPSLSRSMQNDDGWNQVQSKGGRSSQPVDPSRLKITKRTDSDNISLGPGGRPGAWAQGASGGGSSRFLPGDGESRQGNRFSALSGGEQGSFRHDSKGRLGLKGQPQSRFGRPGGGMTGSGRRHQNTSEKAAAIENVRKMMSSEERRSASPPSTQQKGGEYDTEDTITAMESNGVPIQSDVADVDDTGKNIPDEVSDEKVKNETKMTIEEYFVNRDQREAEICIKELKCSTKYHIMVSEAIGIAIEKKLEQGILIGELLHQFVKSGLITLDAFKLGLGDILEIAEDMAVDIPHLWTNLGGLLGPAVEGETLPLSDLKTLIEPLIECNKASLLMAEVLAAAAKISNESNISQLWQRSGLAWEKLLPEGTELQTFIAKHKMEFTLKMDANLEERSLKSLFEDPSSTVELVIEYIQDNIPLEDQISLTFVRDLAASILSGGVKAAFKFDSSQIKKFGGLLVKYVDSDKNKEVEILYAAQLLADEFKHPKDFLREIFEVLYDEEIISDEAINAWVVSGNKLSGKGTALHSVQGFLDWLNSGHDENKR